MITITHTHADGTLVDGTDRGDGSAQILKGCRFRWFPSIKMWGIAQSRDHLAKRVQINQAAEQLRAAGFEVTVEIDDTPREVAQVKADRADRLDDRRDALTAKAERNAAEADARFARSNEIALARNGQPRLAGHYSCRAWDADQKRIENNDRLGSEAYGKAKHYEQAASVVGNAEAYRERPDVIIRRIAKNEAELRQTMHYINGTRPANDWRGAYGPEPRPATGAYLEQYQARKTFLEHQLEADREALEQAKGSGYHCHSRETIHKGDRISWGWGSGEVGRVSAKSVSVPNRYGWSDRISYERITQVTCPHGETTAAA